MPKNIVTRAGNALLVYDNAGGVTQWSISRLNNDPNFHTNFYKSVNAKTYRFALQFLKGTYNYFRAWTAAIDCETYAEYKQELNENLLQCG